VSAIRARRFRQTVVALAGLGSVMGLGGVEAAGAQAQPNACELLTRKEAREIIGQAVRRETNITGTEASQCSYTAEKDAKHVLGLGVGELPSAEEASNRWALARANAQADGLKIENVRRVGQRAYWLPQTNNFERTVVGEQVDFGELTVLEGRRVYSVFVAPPSKNKARDAFSLVSAD
jgi:hypothetical protein